MHERLPPRRLSLAFHLKFGVTFAGGGRGGGGFGRQADGGAPRGSGPGQRGVEFTEGKLFLGGLDNATTKESLQNYCLQW